MKIAVKINENYLFMGGTETTIDIRDIDVFGKTSIHGRRGFRLVFKTLDGRQGTVLRSKHKGAEKKFLDQVFKSFKNPVYEGAVWKNEK